MLEKSMKKQVKFTHGYRGWLKSGGILL